MKFNGEIFGYADDTALILWHDDFDALVDKASRELLLIRQWFDLNFLCLNLDKTNILNFSISRKITTHNLVKIHDHSCSSVDLDCTCASVPFSESVKYLGITFDRNLNFKSHISSLIGRLRKLYYVFRVVRDFLPEGLLRTLYFGLANSLMRYGITVWGGTFKSYLKPLQTVQNGLIKILLKKPFRFSTNLLYKEFNVCNIDNIFLTESCIMVYRTGIHPDNFSNLPTTRTAITCNISLPKMNSEFYKRNSYIRALYVFRKFCINPSQSPNLNRFKSNLTTIIRADNVVL